MSKPVPWLENESPLGDKRVAPATSRNRDPITEVLRAHLPTAGTVLEIASGTGEHLVHFARTFANLTWVPSDPDREARASIAAYAKDAALSNIAAPLELDAGAKTWPIAHADAIVCINMIHISPWRATLGLAKGAERILQKGGLLYLYGPYLRKGIPTAEGNLAFDQSLRSRDPEWGLRALEVVTEVFAECNLRLESFVEMPANNLSVMFRRG
ncbi:MAG: DUF938 domain-containing protein [Polyangiaceae bacterium]|nr:DUF938 domain-containing protein [Polyangiaceae bacterium]